MKLSHIPVLMLLIFMICSCNKEKSLQLENNDYIYFGRSGGGSLGNENKKVFKLTESALYNIENYSFTEIRYTTFEKLSNFKYNRVKNLTSHFPEQLLLETNDRIGCPDCYDQGLIIIHYYKNKVLRKWLIDPDKIPEYLKPFIDKINVKLDKLD